MDASARKRSLLKTPFRPEMWHWQERPEFLTLGDYQD